VHLMLRYPSGARGMIWASQVAPGNDNGILVRVYGERAGLSWHQERPEELIFTRFGEPPQRLVRGGPGLPGMPMPYVPRGPSGHPEGYLEAFAQLYTDVAEQIAAREEGREPSPDSLLVATVEEGAAGMRFVRAALESSRQGGTWVPPG
jgi:predicted dehydrogenase